MIESKRLVIHAGRISSLVLRRGINSSPDMEKGNYREPINNNSNIKIEHNIVILRIARVRNSVNLEIRVMLKLFLFLFFFLESEL